VLLGPLHCDADYGHQEGEINFWLVLVDEVEADNTLWKESAPGKGDFEPVLVKRGEVLRFHGQSCRHLAVTGQRKEKKKEEKKEKEKEGGGEARVSMDFRCALKSQLDADWKRPPGLPFYHEWRSISG